MFKRLKGIKDLLWAAAIGLALLFLFVGLIAAAFTSYHGDRTRPVMNLRGEKQEESAAETPVVKSSGLQPDGTLHPLAETGDAGESYLDSLTFLCDSSFSALRGAELTKAAVWSSETGSLPMNIIDSWKIRYPVDGSSISPASAAMTAKPGVLILAVGSDGTQDMTKDGFVENYSSLIRAIAKGSPDTRIVCLSLPSVAASYAGEDLSKDRVEEINGWIKAVCVETGAYYADLSDVLCKDGWLRDEFADGSGRALNTSGLREVLSYLRNHSLDAQ